MCSCVCCQPVPTLLERFTEATVLMSGSSITGLPEDHPAETHLVDPEGRRPGLKLIHAQLFHLGEAGIAHTVPQIQPGIMTQQHLAPICGVPQLLC